MTEVASASTLLTTGNYDFVFRGAKGDACFLTRLDSDPDAVLVAEYHHTGTNRFGLVENPQGAIQLRNQPGNKWLRGTAAGGLEWTDDPAAAIHFKFEDSPTSGLVRLCALHNQDRSSMLEGSYLCQADVESTSTCSAALLTQSPGDTADWQATGIYGVLPAVDRWLQTYQPALRHSAVYFMLRINHYLDDSYSAHLPAAELATKLKLQLHYGMDDYDPSAANATPEATVNAGLLRAHGGFYQDQEPDDELKEPPDWNEVKGGLDDAGFPDS